MKYITLGLIVLCMTWNAGANDDILGNEDDSYFGMQISIPLERPSNELFSKQTRYSLLLLNQQDGMREGVTYTYFSKGGHSFNYLQPTREFELGVSRIEHYGMPLVQFDSDGNYRSNADPVTDPLIFGVTVIAGAAVLLKVTKDAADDVINDLQDSGEEAGDDETEKQD